MVVAWVGGREEASLLEAFSLSSVDGRSEIVNNHYVELDWMDRTTRISVSGHYHHHLLLQKKSSTWKRALW